jgi:hypothetical protein
MERNETLARATAARSGRSARTHGWLSFVATHYHRVTRLDHTQLGRQIEDDIGLDRAAVLVNDTLPWD